jgi:hypothetical protein
MKRKSWTSPILGAVVTASLLMSGRALADGGFVVEGVKAHDGEPLKVDLWKSDLAAKVCEIDTLTLLYGQSTQVQRDEAGQPVSCSKEKVAKLTDGTRVEEMAPSDSCNTRHPPGTYRRVRVLDGPETGKVGCINASALVHKNQP